MIGKEQNKVNVKIVETKHGNFDFYISLNGKSVASSIDSYATREDCIRIATAVMLCVDCSKSLNDWKQAEAEHINEDKH